MNAEREALERVRDLTTDIRKAIEKVEAIRNTQPPRTAQSAPEIASVRLTDSALSCMWWNASHLFNQITMDLRGEST